MNYNNCLHDGLHEGYECECDECDYLMACMELDDQDADETLQIAP